MCPYDDGPDLECVVCGARHSAIDAESDLWNWWDHCPNGCGFTLHLLRRSAELGDLPNGLDRDSDWVYVIPEV